MQLPTICTHWTSSTSLKSIEKAKKNDSNHSKNYPTTSFYGTVHVPPIMPVINHFYFSRDFFPIFFFQVFYLKDYELLLRKHLSPDTCLARESTLLIWFPSLPIIAKPLEPITPVFYFCVMQLWEICMIEMLRITSQNCLPENILVEVFSLVFSIYLNLDIFSDFQFLPIIF